MTMITSSRCNIGSSRWAQLAIALPLLALACNQPPPPTADGDGIADGSSDGSGQDTGDESGDESGDEGELPDIPDSDTDTDTDTDTGTDTGVEEPTGSLYPLVDGARWTYVLTTNSGQIEGMDIVEAAETTWDGDQAWEITDSPNQKGNWAQSVLVRDGDMTMRVHKERHGPLGVFEIVDYDPGFPRSNDKWDTVGQFEEHFYERTAYDGAGENPSEEDRGHSFEVIAIEPITVPAGTFKAIQVERVRTVGAAAGERVISWYVPGVGKIREVRPAESEIEELVSVSIPGGASYP